MDTDLSAARRLAASRMRDNFDFGGQLVAVEDWREDERDHLTSVVGIRTGMRQQLHPLTVRVSFRPGAVEPSHISVAERLVGA